MTCTLGHISEKLLALLLNLYKAQNLASSGSLLSNCLSRPTVAREVQCLTHKNYRI
jgi:hypothetical protein